MTLMMTTSRSCEVLKKKRESKSKIVFPLGGWVWGGDKHCRVFSCGSVWRHCGDDGKEADADGEGDEEEESGEEQRVVSRILSSGSGVGEDATAREERFRQLCVKLFRYYFFHEEVTHSQWNYYLSWSRDLSVETVGKLHTVRLL